MNATDHDTAPNAAAGFAEHCVRDTLGRSTDVDACRALATRINALLDQALDQFRRGGAAIACQAGCSFCCHLRVEVYPHEAIALYRYLGARMPKDVANRVRQRVLENAAHHAASPVPGGRRPLVPCAFLIDGRCSAYEVRPAACSAYHSLDRGRCEAVCRNGGDAADGTPVVAGLRYVAALLDEGVEHALATLGLSATRIELHTALAEIIRHPASIARWRSGRELVKGSREMSS